jgi:hypothetical protein
MALSVTYAERATTDLSSLDYFQRESHVTAGPPVFDQEHLVDMGSVFRSLTAAHPYLLGIAAETDYFEK